MDGWQDKTNQVVENVKGRIKQIRLFKPLKLYH